jgi:1-acyl-sn-glycerol-3-phosphate acyltransferase
VRERSELNGWWRLGIAVVGALYRACFRLRFRGARHIPNSGPAIVAANHISALDGPVLALATVTGSRRGVRFLVAAEFFEHRLIGPVMRLYEQIPIRRGAGDDGALDEVTATISAGALAGIFPEGRVNPGTELQRVRTGLARIALATGAPVVPAGIWGTQHRWPNRGLTFRRPLRPKVAVVYGEPILPSGDPRDANDTRLFSFAISEAIERQVAAARRLAGD